MLENVNQIQGGMNCERTNYNPENDNDIEICNRYAARVGTIFLERARLGLLSWEDVQQISWDKKLIETLNFSPIERQDLILMTAVNNEKSSVIKGYKTEFLLKKAVDHIEDSPVFVNKCGAILLKRMYAGVIDPQETCKVLELPNNSRAIILGENEKEFKARATKQAKRLMTKGKVKRFFGELFGTNWGRSDIELAGKIQIQLNSAPISTPASESSPACQTAMPVLPPISSPAPSPAASLPSAAGMFTQINRELRVTKRVELIGKLTALNKEYFERSRNQGVAYKGLSGLATVLNLPADGVLSHGANIILANVQDVQSLHNHLQTAIEKRVYVVGSGYKGGNWSEPTVLPSILKSLQEYMELSGIPIPDQSQAQQSVATTPAYSLR